MLRHLMVDGIEFLIIPVIVMDHSCLGIIRNQDTGNTAEKSSVAPRAKGSGFDSRHERSAS